MTPIRLGFAITGSFCTFAKVFESLQQLQDTGLYEIQPIFSVNAATLDTRFGKAADWLARAKAITGRAPWRSLVEVEPIGPKKLLDLVLIAPCTGNTLAKLAGGITDTPVTLATKAHLRNARPVVIAVSSNDALSVGAKNIGLLMNQKQMYFVPLRQDDAVGKPCSLVADFHLLEPTLQAALAGIQTQPLLL